MTEKEMVGYLEQRHYGVIHPTQYRMDFENSFWDIWSKVKDFTMISPERGYALFKAVEYIVKRPVGGACVECGVWKGGACMLIAYALQFFGNIEREIYLFDTFTGMTPPTEEDRLAWNDQPMKQRWQEHVRGTKKHFAGWAVGAGDVEKNLSRTGYRQKNFKIIPGDVLETLPVQAPQKIALLRLDTDWYNSTLHELRHLYDCLNQGGVLCIDDYGHFTGARKAVDTFFSEKGDFMLFHRDDYTGRTGIKCT